MTVSTTRHQIYDDLRWLIQTPVRASMPWEELYRPMLGRLFMVLRDNVLIGPVHRAVHLAIDDQINEPPFDQIRLDRTGRVF